MDRCESEIENMIPVTKYIIDIEHDHMSLLKILATDRMDKDLTTIEFIDILDTIMGTAYKLFTGDTREKVMDDLYTGILNEFFSKPMFEHMVEQICSIIEQILNKFLVYLITISISTNRVLFIENATKKGIFITEYDVTYLRNNNSKR